MSEPIIYDAEIIEEPTPTSHASSGSTSARVKASAESLKSAAAKLPLGAEGQRKVEALATSVSAIADGVQMLSDGLAKISPHVAPYLKRGLDSRSAFNDMAEAALKKRQGGK